MKFRTEVSEIGQKVKKIIEKSIELFSFLNSEKEEEYGKVTEINIKISINYGWLEKWMRGGEWKNSVIFFLKISVGINKFSDYLEYFLLNGYKTK